MHIIPDRHTLPQPPQLLESEASTAQYVLPPAIHAVYPLAHVVAHEPFTQRWPPAHALPQAPQLFESTAVTVHLPPQLVCPAGQLLFDGVAQLSITSVSAPSVRASFTFPLLASEQSAD